MHLILTFPTALHTGWVLAQSGHFFMVECELSNEYGIYIVHFFTFFFHSIFLN